MGTLRSCLVSFCDSAGIRHSAEVIAETLYEAAVLGLAAIEQTGGGSAGAMTAVQVEVRAPVVRHELTVRQVHQWIDSASPSPKDKLLKERLRPLLSWPA